MPSGFNPWLKNFSGLSEWQEQSLMSMPTPEAKFWKWLLNLLKIYTVTVPLILASLVRVVGLDGWLAVHLISIACTFSFVVFLCAAMTQPAVKSQRKKFQIFLSR
jgi:predicted membrane-bound dolichyl-phosphate-mannose-protein mannosyltransferase